jgi:7-cyano-7-deazaguanine synthase
MLSIAAGIAYVEKVYDIVGGWNAVDYSGYPDCRPEFFAALMETIDLALGFKTSDVNPQKVTIYTPLIHLTKAEIIILGRSLKVPYGLTWSCYAGGDVPCGECDSCKIRVEGFASAGEKDPALLEA